MKIPEFRYRSSLIFGDSNWYAVSELSQLELSTEDPNTFYVGDTFIQPIYGAATKIKSEWLWRYGFPTSTTTSVDVGTYGRWYGSGSTGSNGSSGPADWGVGVNTSTYYTVASGNTVEEAYRTEGSSITKTSITKVRFGSATSWYFYLSFSTAPAAANRAIVCRFKATYEADLPSDLYTISGNTVTWNTTHPIYILLYGKKCIPY